jgi:hypothetical protein
MGGRERFDRFKFEHEAISDKNVDPALSHNKPFVVDGDRDFACMLDRS